jgi:uncharacterized membrane protein
LFIAQKSAETYRDYNGTCLAAFFACVIFVVLWLPDTNKLRGRIAFDIISSLLAVGVFSAFQLAATIGVQTILAALKSPKELLMIAPHLTGILAGISAFIIVNDAVQPKIVGAPRVTSQTVLRTVGALSISAVITHFANLTRFEHTLLSTLPGALFSLAHVVVSTTAIVLVVRIYYSARFEHTYLRLLLLGALAVGLSVTLALCHQLVEYCLHRTQTNFWSLNLQIYLIPALSVVVAGYTAAALFRIICKSVYVQE